jgi:hypothetical protein
MPINSFLYPAPSTPSFVYDVDNSLRFDDGSSDYLQISSSSGSNTTGTFSAWIKRGNLSSTQCPIGVTVDGNNFINIQFNSSNQLNIRWYDDGSPDANYNTTAVFRDVSAWYHVVIAFDTTQSTSSDRVKVYVNNTLHSLSGYPSQNTTIMFNTGSATLQVGSSGFANSFFDGYMAEVIWIDGTALDPTSFGEFNSDSPTIWQPIDVSGLTFGTNGFHLDFENASSLGADVSGNSNNFTVNNLTSVDQSTDTCTNNFATMNSLIPNSNITYSQGNLRTQQDSYGNNRISLSTIAVSAGKWYVEHKISQHQDATHTGIVAADSVYSTSNSLAQMENAYAYKNDGNVQEYDQSNIDTGEATYTAGDIIGIALDMDNNKLYFHKNGTYLNSGDPAGNSNGYSITSGKEYYFAKAQNYAKFTDWNFGSPSFSISSGNSDGNGFGNFEYAVPSGFLAVCTKNLGESG